MRNYCLTQNSSPDCLRSPATVARSSVSAIYSLDLPTPFMDGNCSSVGAAGGGVSSRRTQQPVTEIYK